MIDPKLIEINQTQSQMSGQAPGALLRNVDLEIAITRIHNITETAQGCCLTFFLWGEDTPEFPVISTIIQGTPESRPLIPSQPQPKKCSPKSLIEGLKKSLKGIRSDAMYL